MAKRRANGSKKNAKKPRDDRAVPGPVVPEDAQPPKALLPFKLPDLVFEQVFQSLCPADIIRFAMCSVKSYNLLNNNFQVRATQVVLETKTCDVSTDYFVHIEIPNHQRCVVNICVDSLAERYTNGMSYEKVWGCETIIMLGPALYRERTDGFDVFVGRRSDARIVGLEMFKLVLNVFNTTDIQLISVGSKSDDDLFTFARGDRKFSRAVVRWHHQNSMKNGELESVLGSLSADAMYLNVYLPRIKYTGPINKRILHAAYASWLTGECLLNMNCEILIAQGTQLTINDFNVFFNEWQTNRDKYQRLELIRMEQHDRFPLDPEELCLEKWPPRGTTVEVPYPESTWYCKRGDLLATLELRNGNKVMFCVWSEKYLSRRDNHYEEPTRVQALWPRWIIS